MVDDRIRQALNHLDTLVEESPHEALVELRALFCDARANHLKGQHEIVYLMAKAYYLSMDYLKCRKLVEGWLKSHHPITHWRFKLFNLYAAVLQVMGFYPDAFRAYNDSLRVLETYHDENAHRTIYLNLLFLCNNMGAYGEGLRIYQRLKPYLLGSEDEHSKIAVVYSKTLAHCGGIAEAKQMLDRAYRHCYEVKNYRYLGFIWERRGEIAALEGDLDLAIFLLEKGKRLLSEFSNPSDLCYCCSQLGALYQEKHYYEQAIAVYEEGIYSALLSHMPLLIQDSYFRLASCYRQVGDRDIALESYKRHISHIEKMALVSQHQQARVLDLLLEKHQVQSDTDHIKAIHSQWLTLNREVEVQSQRVYAVTRAYDGLREIAVTLSSDLSPQQITGGSVARLRAYLDYSIALVGYWDDLEQCYSFHEILPSGLDADFFDVWETQTEALKHKLLLHYQMSEAILLSLKPSIAQVAYGPVFAFLKADADPYDPYDRALLDAFGALLEGALRLSDQVKAIKEQQQIHTTLLQATKDTYRRLKELSFYDELTLLYNRAGMNYCFEQWQYSSIFPTEMVAVVLDLDHFKQFNDCHGHLEGDKLLRAFSGLLKDQFDEKAFLLARFGGEEFLLLAPAPRVNDVYSQCLAVLEKTRVLHKETTAETSRPIAPVTVSIGIEKGIIKDIGAVYQLIESADQQLYKAKQRGRDQICWTMGD